MKKITNFKKLKIAGLTVLAAGGLFWWINKYQNEIEPDGQTEALKENIVQKPLTAQQLERCIKDSDEYLAELDSVINSKDTDAETRFEARRAYKYTLEKRAEIQKRLAEMTNRQIDFHDAAKLR